MIDEEEEEEEWDGEGGTRCLTIICIINIKTARAK